MVAVDVLNGCEAFGNMLAGLDPEVYSGTDCAEVVELLARAEKRSAGARLLFAARAAECRAYKERGYSSPATWLARTSGVSAGEAKSSLDTAVHLAECPETREALLAGEISLVQANEIARTEQEAPGSEADLLNRASTGSINGLKEECRRRRLAARDPDELEEVHRRQRRERYERHWTDDQAMGHLAAAWPAEVYVAVANRIDAEVDDLLRKARRDGVEPEPVERLRADALASLILDAGAGRRLGRPELVLVCDVAAFQRGQAQVSETCHIAGGGPVPVSVAQEIAVSSFIKGVLHNGTTIEQVAHFRGRFRSAHLQTALGLGDPPLFPGIACVDCGRRYGIQWDHADPVAHGGPTSYANMQPLCYPCHQAKTQRDRAAGLLTPRPPGSHPTTAQATTAQATTAQATTAQATTAQATTAQATTAQATTAQATTAQATTAQATTAVGATTPGKTPPLGESPRLAA